MIDRDKEVLTLAMAIKASEESAPIHKAALESGGKLAKTSVQLLQDSDLLFLKACGVFEAVIDAQFILKKYWPDANVLEHRPKSKTEYQSAGLLLLWKGIWIGGDRFRLYRSMMVTAARTDLALSGVQVGQNEIIEARYLEDISRQIAYAVQNPVPWKDSGGWTGRYRRGRRVVQRFLPSPRFDLVI